MAPHWVLCPLGIVMIISPTLGIRYAIMTSEVIRPGQKASLHISLYSTNIESSSVLVEFKQNSRSLFSREYAVNHTVGLFVEFTVPDDITAISCQLKVTGLDNFRFSTYRYIRVDLYSRSGFIQTDKGVYNPGNIVRYRVLYLDLELKTYKGKFDITVKDPAKNLIKEDKAISGDFGLVEGMLQLSEEPLLGEWTIIAKAKGLPTKTKTFDVRQYVLPRFEVSIVPKKSYAARYADESVSGVVKAKYSSGKNIKGQLLLTVKADFWYKYMRINGVMYDTQPTIQETLTIDGEAQFSYSMSQLENLTAPLIKRTVIIQASVVEDLTGEIMNATANIKVYMSTEKAAFMSFNPNSFKPGLQYEGNIFIQSPLW